MYLVVYAVLCTVPSSFKDTIAGPVRVLIGLAISKTLLHTKQEIRSDIRGICDDFGSELW